MGMDCVLLVHCYISSALHVVLMGIPKMFSSKKPSLVQKNKHKTRLQQMMATIRNGPTNCFCKNKFYWNNAMFLSTFTHCLTAFTLQWQIWIVLPIRHIPSPRPSSRALCFGFYYPTQTCPASRVLFRASLCRSHCRTYSSRELGLDNYSLRSLRMNAFFFYLPSAQCQE